MAAKNRKPRNLIAAAAQGAGINDSDGLGVFPVDQVNKKLKTNHKIKPAGPTLEDNIAAAMQSNYSPVNDDNPFKVMFIFSLM